jgi:hypothetical protein
VCPYPLGGGTTRKEALSGPCEPPPRGGADERDRVARICEAALCAAVQERAIRLADGYGQQLAAVLRAIFYDPELGLTTQQLALLPTILRRHLFVAERPSLGT